MLKRQLKILLNILSMMIGFFILKNSKKENQLIIGIYWKKLIKRFQIGGQENLTQINLIKWT